MHRVVVVAGIVERTVLVAAFALIMLALFADILGRELVGSGLYWASRLGIYGFFYIAFLGLPLATEKGAHIRPRFMDGCLARLPEKGRCALEHGIAAVINGFLGLVCLSYLLGSAKLGEQDPVTGVPLWGFLLALPYGFCSASLRHLYFAAFPDRAPRADISSEGE